MPEYLAPGVYVEETSFRAKSLEGVGTSTTAFVGPTRRGPVDDTPELVTSYADYERIYGSLGSVHGRENYVAHGVRAYFNEGGSRLYVARVFTPNGGDDDGRARSRPLVSQGEGAGLREARFVARFPGRAGNGKITIRRIYQPATADTLKEAPQGTLVRTGGDDPARPAVVTGASGGPFTVEKDQTLVLKVGGAGGGGDKTVNITFKQGGGETQVPKLEEVTPADLDKLLKKHGVTADTVAGRLRLATVHTGETATLRIDGGTALEALGLAAHAEGDAEKGSGEVDRGWFVRDGDAWKNADGGSLNPADSGQAKGGLDIVSLLVETEDGDGMVNAYEGLSLGEQHPRFLGNVLSMNPTRRSDHLEQAFAFVGGGFDALALHAGLFPNDTDRPAEEPLAGGNDGAFPTEAAYKDALEHLLPLEDISILAAPGHTAFDGWEGVQGALIAHVSQPRRYQIAVLDTPPDEAISGARAVRSRIDSKYAALYYPWVRVQNPRWRPGRDDRPREINLPPSGFVTGIYARNDVERGVHKAPANEVVRGALRFESDVNFAEQGVLNPIGVNCLRFFPGRGFRVWGARTVSSDPEWKYVNVRRYFNYLERTVDVGTQWAVFEPNGEALWANVRQTVSSFLYNEWRSGALLGSDAKEAYFVRCDRSTMTQNDLDSGRLICLVGVAVLKPAEFVIFRIGQKTADARD
jgi:uncharacterized protein